MRPTQLRSTDEQSREQPSNARGQRRTTEKGMTTMTLNKLMKRLSILAVLAALGFGLTGCSMMHKRQTAERPAPGYWSDARYEYPNR
jgi:hypothetical protein